MVRQTEQFGSSGNDRVYPGVAHLVLSQEDARNFQA